MTASFYLAVAGVFGVWAGALNMVGRRLAARRWGALGSERSVWTKGGLFFAPDWMSLPLLVTGLISLAAAGIVWVLGS